MPLTTAVRQARSPIGSWMRTRFPQTRWFASRIRDEAARHPRQCRLPDDAPAWVHGLVGRAMDYRLRMALGPVDPAATRAAQLGAWWGTLEVPADLLWFGPFMQTRIGLCQAFLERHKPHRYCLAPDAEQTLARHCLWLSLAEGWIRNPEVEGGLWDALRGGPRADVDGVLPRAWVDDLAHLATVLMPEQLAPLTRRPWHPNPEFAGAATVGGADGDLIAGDGLWEFKCTIRPAGTNQWLFQLLGYVLLDWDGRHALKRVGLVLPRQRAVLAWSIDHLLAATQCPTPDLDRLRAEFRDLCESTAGRP